MKRVGDTAPRTVRTYPVDQHLAANARCDCGTGFTLGGVYTRIPTRNPDVVVVACVSCATKGATR